MINELDNLLKKIITSYAYTNISPNFTKEEKEKLLALKIKKGNIN